MVGTSTLITRMTSDINQVQNGVNMTLRLLLRSPFVVFGAMIMAFTVDVRTAMVFAVVRFRCSASWCSAFCSSACRCTKRYSASWTGCC